MTNTTLVVKIEKIKRQYDEYMLSFTTQARNLPQYVPVMPIAQAPRKVSLLTAVDEEITPNYNANNTEGDFNGENYDDSFISADSFTRTTYRV